MCHCLMRILDRKHHRPYFFENEAGQTATVNGARYRNMITQFFLPKLDDIDVANMWFQQDNATCYIANETIQLLHETFPSRIFSRFGDQKWPPRSCDLIPLDFFLWGYLKSNVYINNTTTTCALQEEIKHCINEIQPQLCRKVMKNFDERVGMCQQTVEAICPMCYSINNPILYTLGFTFITYKL